MAAFSTIAAVGAAAATAGSAIAGSKAAGRAADASAEATRLSVAEQRRQYDTSLNLLSPQITAGNNALAFLSAAYGLPLEGIFQTPDQVNDSPLRQFTGGGSAQPAAPAGNAASRFVYGDDGEILAAFDPQSGSFISPQRGSAGGGSAHDVAQNRREQRIHNQRFADLVAGAPVISTAGIGGESAPGTLTADQSLINAFAGGDQGARRDIVLNSFQESPGYQFQFDEGVKAIRRGAAARGSLQSGRTLKALNAFGQGIANQEFNNYLAGLGGLAGVGTGATNTAVGVGQSTANNISNAFLNDGTNQGNAALARGSSFQRAAGGLTYLAGQFV